MPRARGRWVDSRKGEGAKRRLGPGQNFCSGGGGRHHMGYGGSLIAEGPGGKKKRKARKAGKAGEEWLNRGINRRSGEATGAHLIVTRKNNG